MVAATGFESLDALVDATVPKAIRRPDLMDLGAYTEGMRESEFLTKFKCAPGPSRRLPMRAALVCALSRRSATSSSCGGHARPCVRFPVTKGAL